MKKKFLVIGNPIDHSLSPKLHNYWIKKYKIDAVYEKKLLNNNEIKDLIFNIREEKLHGINVTVPFKKFVIPFLDELTPKAETVQSVNTIIKKNNKIVGANTDIYGFESSLSFHRYELKNKKVFILGAGGVVPSILYVLKKCGVSRIALSNRTKKKTDSLKKIFPNLEIIDWGQTPEFDMIINATSLGLKDEDKIILDIKRNAGSPQFFYDLIYKTGEKKTNFIKKGDELGHITQDGSLMFVHQAEESFRLWDNEKDCDLSFSDRTAHSDWEISYLLNLNTPTGWAA